MFKTFAVEKKSGFESEQRLNKEIFVNNLLYLTSFCIFTHLT